jgi:hypothetical protein
MSPEPQRPEPGPPSWPGNLEDGVRIDGAWLDDLIELRRDHESIRSLILIASRADAHARQHEALSLCIELFRLHVRIERSIPGIQALASSIECVLLLMEQLESILHSAEPADDALLMTGLCSLREHLEVLLPAEDDCYARWKKLAPTDPAGLLQSMDTAVRARRSALLRSADAMLAGPASSAG